MSTLAVIPRTLRTLNTAAPAVLLLLAWLVFSLSSCKPEAQRLVDELCSTLDETDALLQDPSLDPEQKAQRILELLEAREVALRQMETRIDDVVRTLNDKQRESLTRYAQKKIEDFERSFRTSDL